MFDDSRVKDYSGREVTPVMGNRTQNLKETATLSHTARVSSIDHAH